MLIVLYHFWEGKNNPLNWKFIDTHKPLSISLPKQPIYKGYVLPLMGQTGKLACATGNENILT